MYDENPKSPFQPFILPVLGVLWIAVIVSIFKLNPYLFTRTTLSEQVQKNKEDWVKPFPSRQLQPELTEEALKPSKVSLAHYFKNNISPENDRISRKLNRIKKRTIPTPFDDKDPHWIKDNSQIIAWHPEKSHFVVYEKLQEEKAESEQESKEAAKEQEEEASDSAEIVKRWSFFFSTDEQHLIDRPELSQSLIFAASKANTLVAVDRTTGKLRWSLQLGHKLLWSPILINDKLWVSTQPANGNGTKVVLVEAESGEPLKDSLDWSFDLAIRPSLNEAKQALYLASKAGELQKYSLEENKFLWTHKGETPLTAPPIEVDGQVVFSNSDGVAMGLDVKTGEAKWDYKLKDPSHSSFVAVPDSPFIAILTDDGYLHTLNIKTGTGQWRFNTQSKAINQELFAVRLTNKDIEERELKWHYKGWVIWSPCVENRICMFNPEEGNMVGRLFTTGQIATPPLFEDALKDGFHLILKKFQDDKTTPKWELAEYIERSKFLRLTQKSRPKPQPKAEPQAEKSSENSSETKVNQEANE